VSPGEGWVKITSKNELIVGDKINYKNNYLAVIDDDDIKRMRSEVTERIWAKWDRSSSQAWAPTNHTFKRVTELKYTPSQIGDREDDI